MTTRTDTIIIVFYFLMFVRLQPRKVYFIARRFNDFHIKAMMHKIFNRDTKVVGHMLDKQLETRNM